ncbi:NADPH-dependent FMN reductase [Streptomyces lonarensis]|uniref:NADPH-dependent FMN reductase n=1 Tax=Streptomyces lonarensis TaxID=700599 RepID=A0A7X6D1R8_9ACTN|nr:NADPH-dependent FMN reductase [Streptomyces lonarensis]NJQ06618.1 NADPH-dependent FMN reductase [Streptomyces lonarensis]
MTQILAVSGGNSPFSRAELLVPHAVDRLTATGFDAAHLAVHGLPAEELLAGRAESAAILGAVDAVALADGVIVVTPVVRGAYSGVLKTFLDLLPHAALAGKTVLPLVTSASTTQLLALDYALRPVLSALGARHIVGGCLFLDDDVERSPTGGTRLRDAAEQRLFAVVDDFVESLPAHAGAGG